MKHTNGKNCSKSKFHLTIDWSDEFLCDEMSVWQNVRVTKCLVTKCLYDEMSCDEKSCDEMSCDEMSVWRNVNVTKCLVTKCHLTKCPCDDLSMWPNVLWRIVRVTNCLWDEMSVWRVIRVTKLLWRIVQWRIVMWRDVRESHTGNWSTKGTSTTKGTASNYCLNRALYDFQFPQFFTWLLKNYCFIIKNRFH